MRSLRRAAKLQTFLVVRSELDGVPLATVTAASFPTADGTRVPGYLAMPPGAGAARNLAAIVMTQGAGRP
jgi:dipeptidyl aminopeptidase/acylaminoacyl peptidase